jgi:hypothetical protein
VFHEFVYAFNVIYKNLISWPQGVEMLVFMEEFMKLCQLPNVQGAIDGTHLSIPKPQRAFVENYYYHKIGGYNIMAQLLMFLWVFQMMLMI